MVCHLLPDLLFILGEQLESIYNLYYKISFHEAVWELIPLLLLVVIFPVLYNRYIIDILQYKNVHIDLKLLSHVFWNAFWVLWHSVIRIPTYQNKLPLRIQEFHRWMVYSVAFSIHTRKGKFNTRAQEIFFQIWTSTKLVQIIVEHCMIILRKRDWWVIDQKEGYSNMYGNLL